ncbi:MAG TPA: ABC transporter substrate-binding protein [Solirubrobacterales bacterium]|nr:ABC transporter substrate-binding protein [Solirubrobacterales bacterium]
MLPIAVVVAVLLAGCGAAGDGTPRDGATNAAAEADSQSAAPLELKVVVDGWMRPEVAGLLMAEARGYFREAGLKVSLGVPWHPRRAVPYMTEKFLDIAVAQEPQVVIAKSSGAPLVILGSLIAQPTEAMIWLRGSRISSVADLKGKTVAYPGIPYQKKFLQKALEHAGLTLKDVNLDQVGYELIPTLLKHTADAAFGGWENLDGAELEARGAEPVMTGVRSLGIQDYEQLVVAARSDFVAQHPEAIEGFMSAVARGTATAQQHPREALKVVEEAVEGDIDATRAGTEAQIKATLPLLAPGDPMDLDRAQSLIDWMAKEKMIAKPFSADTLLPEGAGG